MLKLSCFYLILLAPPSLFCAEIADLYTKQTAENGELSGKGRDYSKQIRTEDTEITEVGIERGACFGTCPVFTFIVKADGTFRYKGEQFVKREGEHTGKVSLWRLNTLFQYIRDSDYMKLANNYSAMVTDNATVYSTVVMKGQRKVIQNYACAGPTKLWAVEELIEKLLEDAEWDGENGADDKAPAKNKQSK